MSKITLTEQASTPSTPSAGEVSLFVDDSDKTLKSVDDAGSVTDYTAGGGGGGQTDTVTGANGITNTGDNVNAVLAPTYGSAANTVCQGSDARLSDARTPAGGAGGGLAGTYPNPTVNGMTSGVLSNDTAHGNRGGGALHAAATGSVAGFMSAADKTKLDGVASGATNTPLSATAPVNVTKAAAAAGAASEAARQDHKHDVATAAPSQGIGAGNTEGSSTSLARADHNHTIRESGGQNLTMGAVADGQVLARSGTTIAGTSVAALTGTAPVNVTKAAAAVGVATTAARADHKHDVTTAAAVAATAGQSNAEGSATSLARSDHTHAHAVAAPVSVSKSANATGAAATFSRSDHKHDVTTGAPSSLATASNVEGTATTLARSDHTHRLTALAETLNATNQNITNIKTAGLKVQALGNITGAVNLNLNDGMLVTATLTGNVIFTFGTAPAGAARITLFLKQDGTGNRTATLPSNVWILNGSQPNLSNQAGEANVITLVYTGSEYIASTSGDLDQI